MIGFGVTSPGIVESAGTKTPMEVVARQFAWLPAKIALPGLMTTFALFMRIFIMLKKW